MVAVVDCVDVPTVAAVLLFIVVCRLLVLVLVVIGVLSPTTTICLQHVGGIIAQVTHTIKCDIGFR